MARNQPLAAGSTEIPPGHSSAAMPSRRAVIRTAAADSQHIAVSAPNTVNVLGRSLIPPQSSFARAIVGSTDNLRESSLSSVTRQAVPSMAASHAPPAGMSGLSVLLNQQQQHQQYPHPINDVTQQPALEHQSPTACEADSASGPPPDFFSQLGSSAPGHLGHASGGQGARRSQSTASGVGIATGVLARQHSVGTTIPGNLAGMAGLTGSKSDRVRRYVPCL